MPTTISLPYTLTNGTTADATEVQANLDGIVTEYNTSVAAVTGAIVGTTATQTLTNKTLTTPVVASVYQDAGKTKLLTVPDTASDTLTAIAATQTLTNKRVNPRLVTTTSYTTDTGTSLSVATTDQFEVTAQGGALKLNNPGGTPTGGNKIIIRIKDDGTARALTYDTQYRAIGVTLPSTTVVSKTLYLGGIWNATDSKLDILAVGQEV